VTTHFLDTTRTAYDDWAQRYQAFAKGFDVSPLDDALIDAFGKMVAGTGKVADLGCGPGLLTAQLAAAGCDVFGMDLSPEMIALARADFPQLRFDVGSMTELDIADGELAGLMSWYSTIHTPPEVVPAIFAEFRRVLAPGGLALVGFFSGPDLRDEPVEFDHTVTPGYRWPVDRISASLAEAGLTETARLVREPGEKERFLRGHIVARAHV
jgi:SAM-dependent methyltransferase